MKKLYIILILIIGINTIGEANSKNSPTNKWGIGIKLGGGMSSLTNPIVIDAMPKAGATFNGGLVLYKQVWHNQVALQTELSYHFRFFKDEGTGYGDQNYQVSSIDLPVIVNTRLFNYKSREGLQAVHLVSGFGLSYGLNSKLITDSSNFRRHLGGWDEYEYAQVTSAFADLRQVNTFFVLGINSRLLKGKGKTVGLRYKKFLQSMYQLDEVTETHDFTSKAYCITLDATFYF